MEGGASLIFSRGTQMMQIFKVGFLGMLLLGISSIANAIEIRGTVIGTTGLDVTVKTIGKNSPVSGDLMEISFSIPGGDTLSIGTWKVTSISGRIVSASVVENTGTPSKGQQAVIFSENPVSIKSASINSGSSSNNNQQKGYAAPPVDTAVTPEASEIINLLQSSEATNIRNGAKRAYRQFANNDAVLAIVADVLNRGYAKKTRDGYHVDAMAWLCNVLGASKDMKYKDLLTLVAKKSPSKKIRKYAKKNLRLLR